MLGDYCRVLRCARCLQRSEQKTASARAVSLIALRQVRHLRLCVSTRARADVAASALYGSYQNKNARRAARR